MMPADRRALIAIDLGAESCRVSLLRWIHGAPRIALIHRHAHAPVSRHGELRWALQEIIQQVDHGLRLCAEIATEGVRSIAVDGWAVDYVHLDDHGHALADPFCYRDERTIAALASVTERISPQRLRAITAIEVSRINTLYQLFADNQAVRDKPWLHLPEFMLYRLGARAIAEYTNATHSQLVDAQQHAWSAEVFAAAGLAVAAAPPLVPPGTIVGRLVASHLNLPGLAGTTLIAPACHDTASAIAGIPDSGDQWAYISSGTWSLVGTVLSRPINTPAAQAANFTNLGAVGGRICFHKSVNGMWLLQQCLSAWAGAIDWAMPALLEATARLPAPVALLHVDDPDLVLPGNMPARINRQLVQRGLPALDEAAAAAPHITSLILHSLAARYAEIVRSLAQITGKNFTRIYIVGGGSRNTLLNTLTSLSTSLEVTCGAVESSTLGNFAVQLAALDDPEIEGVGEAAVAFWAGQLSSTSS